MYNFCPRLLLLVMTINYVTCLGGQSLGEKGKAFFLAPGLHFLGKEKCLLISVHVRQSSLSVLVLPTLDGEPLRGRAECPTER